MAMLLSTICTSTGWRRGLEKLETSTIFR